MENCQSKAGVNFQTPVRFADPHPENTDLIVIGGGVVGVFTALFANRMGLKVVLLEKGRIAAEQSSRNWGWIRQQGRDAAELPIVMESTRLWSSVDKELNGRAGFVRGGCLYLAREEGRLETFWKWTEVARQHQLETVQLSSRQLTDVIDHAPGGGFDAPSPWIGGIWTPSDARAEPWAAVPAVAALAHSEGVMIIENCAVRSLDIEAGKVVGVNTEKGCVKSEQTVLAGGAWSAMLLRHHGVFLPQLTVRGSVAQTAPLPHILDGTAIDEGLAIRRREDGGYTLSDRLPQDFYLGWHAVRSTKHFLPTLRSSLANPRIRPFGPAEYPDGWSLRMKWTSDKTSPFERTRVLDPDPSPRAVATMSEEFGRLFPGIGSPEILRSWAGMIDFMPDIVPVVDRIDALDGLILATGMSGHGFGMGPGMAKIVVDLVTAKEPVHSIERFRYRRFFDGSHPEIGPTV